MQFCSLVENIFHLLIENEFFVLMSGHDYIIQYVERNNVVGDFNLVDFLVEASVEFQNWIKVTFVKTPDLQLLGADVDLVDIVDDSDFDFIVPDLLLHGHVNVFFVAQLLLQVFVALVMVAKHVLPDGVSIQVTQKIL